MLVSIIVAVSRNGVIGRDGTLPWRLPRDLSYFKSVTLGKPIIMGRKTFQSIGAPLPDRNNFVISRNSDFRAEGVKTFLSLMPAIEHSQEIENRMSEVFACEPRTKFWARTPPCGGSFSRSVFMSLSGMRSDAKTKTNKTQLLE